MTKQPYDRRLDSKNIVSLHGDAFQSRKAVLSQLFDYWEALRDGRDAPRRAEIDPRKIKDVLPFVFIAELTRFGGTRFRLAGSEVIDLMCMELRGMQLSALFHPEARPMLDHIIGEIYEDGALYRLDLTTEQAGYRMVKGQMILLPLRDDADRTSRILGGVTLDRELLRPPVSFEIRNAVKNRIVIDEPQDLRAAGMAEATASFQRPPRGSRLSLVVDNSG